jgi:hypothetical protein
VLGSQRPQAREKRQRRHLEGPGSFWAAFAEQQALNQLCNKNFSFKH